ncbi:hypothetical protein B0T22DRAFT_441392 [Podospora appendiculata]|uniref:Uncharacterized protein n=1 Tax=Podospora appendiculata TaxID=314037 RepID=A0AAE1CDZ7_9PEZI|nr:hypothetical protein B0T22DRAFT_441392 [Podospora appendiculata]
MDDQSQYRCYDQLLRDPFLNAPRSFDVAVSSYGHEIFRRRHEDIVRCLLHSEAHWRSLSCVGRVRKEDDGQQSIRTTVLVSFSELPSRDEARILEEQLKEAIIKGDPDRDTVYAVTCHHVVSEDPDVRMEWANERGPESFMGVVIQPDLKQARDLAGGREDFGFYSGSRRDTVDRLLIIQKMLLGEDFTSCVHDFLAQMENVLETVPSIDREAIDDELQQGIRDDTTRRLAAGSGTKEPIFNGRVPRLLLSEEDLELMAEDVTLSLILSPEDDQTNPLQVVLEALWDILQNDVEIRGVLVDVFVRVLRMRHIWRADQQALERVLVEHPSLEDRHAIMHFLRSEARKEAHEKADKDENDVKEMSALNDEIRKLERYHEEDRRKFIGIVLASSGKRPRPHPAKFFADDSIKCYIMEDWAIIKLFRREGQQFANTLDTNPLSSDSKAAGPSHIRSVDLSPRATGYHVFKKGRTTNHTVGRIVNSPPFEECTQGGVIRHDVIRPVSPREHFTQPGDGGAWVVDRTGRLVGMAACSDTATGSSGFTPAKYLFAWIQERFEEAMADPAHGVELNDEYGPGERIEVVGVSDGLVIMLLRSLSV